MENDQRLFTLTGKNIIPPTMQLTIITINYNNASGLQKNIESVLAKTSKD